MLMNQDAHSIPGGSLESVFVIYLAFVLLFL